MIDPKEYSGGVNGIPQYKDRKAMWESLAISSMPEQSDPIVKYLSALRKLYTNGSVEYCCFHLGESEVLDWYASRNTLEDMQFFFKFWQQECVTSALPVAEIAENANTYFDDSSPLMLGGSLAAALEWGGAYNEPDWGVEISKELGENAAVELLNKDYDNCVLYEANAAWCSYFYDVAWDRTWVVLNKKSRTLRVIMATDTD